MNKVFVLIAISAVVLTASLSATPVDNNSPYAKNFISGQNHGLGGNKTPSQNANWLGVSLGAVPDVLRGQLGHFMPDGQGVLVMSVNPSSPAFKAGLGRNDVLLGYDDQRLYSPGQLSELIREDKAGREVRLKVLQKGVLKILLVNLGSQQVRQRQSSSFGNWSYPPQGYSPFGKTPPSSSNNHIKPYSAKPDNYGNNKQSLSWDRFELVQVNTLPDGRYHAEISYKDKANETKKFSFEGRREEIIKQITNQSELPADKKKALLNALNMRSGQFIGDPLTGGSLQGNPFMNHPFFQTNPFNYQLNPLFGSPFNGPFFQGSPFNDPFFKRDLQFDQFDFSPWNQRKFPPAQKKGMPEDVI